MKIEIFPHFVLFGVNILTFFISTDDIEQKKRGKSIQALHIWHP